MRILLTLLTLLSWPILASHTSHRHVNILVFSPETSLSSTVGKAHRFWTEQGFTIAGNIILNNTTIKIKPIYIDTQSNDNKCGHNITTLVKKYHPALILGPVRSICVKTLIKHLKSNNINIPIISSLASSTSLTKDRYQWFFRANSDDKKRLEYLHKFIGSSPKYNTNHTLLFYDNKDYGGGLKTDFVSIMGKDNFNENNTNTFTFQEHFKQTDKTSFDHTIIEQNLTTFLSTYDSHNPKGINIYLFGSGKTIVKLAHHIQNILQKKKKENYYLFTVGSSQHILQHAPSNLITIGEVGFNINTSNQLATEFEILAKASKQSGLPFYPTTYTTARFIIPEVIASAYQTVNIAEHPNNIVFLRDQIKTLLEDKHFSSLAPPEQLLFNNGSLSGNFLFPIYQVGKTFKQLNEHKQSKPWLEVLNTNININYLEAPISVTVKGHHTHKYPITLTLINKKTTEIVESKTITLQNDLSQTVNFHTMKFGEFILSSNRDIFPNNIHINVSPSFFYLFCLIASLIGTIMRHKIEQQSLNTNILLICEGILVGFIVAFASTYIKYSFLPISESDWNIINGAIYGFIGGWFGPSLFSVLTQRVIPSK